MAPAGIGGIGRQRGDRMKRRNVRYWHKADIEEVPPNVRFRG